MKYDKIFLIDDEPIINSIQNLYLQKFFPDNSIDKYDGATGALEKLMALDESVQKVLIFVDLNMPVLSGQQFLDQLLKANMHYEVEAYVITFSNDPEEVEQVRKHPYVKKVVRKPVNDAKLIELGFVSSAED